MNLRLIAFSFPLVLAVLISGVARGDDQPANRKSLHVLFIGNSYTARHHLTQLFESMAESGMEGLDVETMSVVYGGRTLAHHWELGTPRVVRLAELTADEHAETISKLEARVASEPENLRVAWALKRHRRLSTMLTKPRPKWDLVVLQSYRDDERGDPTEYAKYAIKFAKLIHEQGARVVLYETTPATENATALESPRRPDLVEFKANALAQLAKQIDATVVPMSSVGLHCQKLRPEMPLRFVNDGHLNQTFAYLTACTLYASIFDRSPVGLPIATVTDTVFLADDKQDQDRDGGPATRSFDVTERTELQQIAWDGLQWYRDRAAAIDRQATGAISE